MADNLGRKYYPAAVKKSPYVILEPGEYSAMMAEEYVKYTDPDLSKMKSFSKIAKYIVIAWVLLATFVIVHQSFSRETVILDQKSNSFFHSIRYVFVNNKDNAEIPNSMDDTEKATIINTPDKKSKVFEGTEKCTPGEIYKPDNCNTCNCGKDGQLACTKMFCMDNQSSFVIV